MGEVSFHQNSTIGVHSEAENKRFTAAGLGCRQNLKINLRPALARFFYLP